MESNVWTNENDERLIKFVRSNEALHNMKSKEYRQRKLKKMLWDEIGEVLNKSGSDCKKRWLCVRDYYVRRRRGKAPTAAGGAQLYKWRCDLLSFLDKVDSIHRGSTSSVADDSLPDFEPEDSVDYPSEDPLNSDEEDKQFGKKRKLKIKKEKLELLEEIAQSNCNDDENDLFFKSMAKIVKKLPLYDQAQLRVQIGSLVGNAEIQSFSRSTHEEDQNYFSR